MLFTILLFVVLIVALLVVFVLFGLPWLADENILVTRVKEGTAKAIMRGDTFERLVMAFEGYHLDEKWNVVVNDVGVSYDKRSRLMKYLGLYWVGWPWANSVYSHLFSWNETRTGGNGKDEVNHREEPTDFIFINDFPYAIITDSAETADRLQTDMLTVITVRTCNPYRALFSTKDWMRRITASVNRQARSFAGEKKYQELLTEHGKGGYSSPIIGLSTFLSDDDASSPPNGLIGRYGVEIRAADLISIELTGVAKEKNQAAAAAAFVAEQEATATRTAADAKAYATKTVASAEAEALEARLATIDNHGEAGIALAGLDAIKEASKNPSSHVIWAANPLGAIADMFGKREKEK